MEIRPSSVVVVVGFRAAPVAVKSSWNAIPSFRTQDTRPRQIKRRALRAQLQRSCREFASARCITLNLPVGRPDITSLVFDTHRVFRDRTFAETILLISFVVEFMYVPSQIFLKISNGENRHLPPYHRHKSYIFFNSSVNNNHIHPMRHREQ